MVTTISFLYNVHSIETACNFKTTSEEESVVCKREHTSVTLFTRCKEVFFEMRRWHEMAVAGDKKATYECMRIQDIRISDYQDEGHQDIRVPGYNL